jgi:hypothetical protein
MPPPIWGALLILALTLGGPWYATWALTRYERRRLLRGAVTPSALAGVADGAKVRVRGRVRGLDGDSFTLADERAEVLVQTAGAHLMPPPGVQIVELRDGSEVVVVGEKSRVIDPTLANRHLRETPLKPLVRGGEHQPLVVVILRS